MEGNLSKGGAERRHFAQCRIAYLILLISILATSWIYLWAQEEIQKRQEASFAQAVAKFGHTMDLYASAYFNILRGINGFCARDRMVTASEFLQFLEVQGIRTNHPGLFDVGFVTRVRASERSGLLDYIRSLGLDLKRSIQFSEQTDEDYVLLFWDSFTQGNILPFGNHIFTEPDRLAAMNRARDDGEIVCSGRTDIFIGNGRIEPAGFILYAPLFKPGVVLKTLEDRRQALKGFAYASFVIPDFWGTIYRATGESMIDFEVYEGREIRTNKLWFNSKAGVRGPVGNGGAVPPRLRTAQTVSRMGRDWTFIYASQAAFETTPEVKIPRLILFAGCGVSAALFALSLRQVRARLRVESLAGELRSSHAAMAQEKERLAVTLGAINEGVIAVDLQGRVILMNRTAEELTGWHSAQARRKPLGDFFILAEAQTQTPIPCPMEEVLRTGHAWTTAKPVLLRARGGIGPMVTVAISCLKETQGGILGAVMAFRDVTERQKLIEERIKSSKLESVGILAGGIAHDFNNILTAILGNISLASAEAADRADPRPFLREADLACARARDLTQQLLTFAKGGAPIRQIALLCEVIRDSARFATHGATARCECQIPDNLWPVEADKGQISQVIQNVVINAAQAMPEGGVIQIAAHNLAEGGGLPLGLGPARYVRISIQDQGTGIRPEHLDKIFDPYFSTKRGGSGLGLATAYSIVKRHEGAITVDSQLGVGTRFEIYLPASNGFPPVTPVGLAASPAPGSGRILVMDDERPILNLLVKMLQKLGYEVIPAVDGAEAVRLYAEAQARGQAIDAVILDLTVPGGVGGEQALKQLAALDPAVKAIVSSGYSNDPVMASYREFGFQAVVPKPYGLDSLAAVLARVCAKSGAGGMN